ncbi:hypothetical protein MBAV_006346 [Candidatus Magnetobacterium bavaricum]|uniref:Uncharacterized protein n=1 Tax=Candidatus Magnetobacterium bavaricum TaxID=29290 RepID=A0A0F3GLA7_9BACT|nr:hypothetical protein MBAV_006346 [Candidatus Magnetobacterium bavaricum]
MREMVTKDDLKEALAGVDKRFNKIEKEMVTKDYLKEVMTDFAAQIGVGVRKIIREEAERNLSRV